ncbi:hypothetical protein Tco_1095348 [Tanacetum coccineum]
MIQYPCLHSPKTTKETSPIRRIQESQYVILKLYGNKIFWKISNVVPTPRNFNTPCPTPWIRHMALPPRDPRFREDVLDLDTARALQFQLGGVKRHMNWREFILALIPDKGDLSAYWIGISSMGDFLGTPPLILLSGMHVGSINVPYLLSRYLRLFASRRKQGAMIPGGLLVIDKAKLVRLQICIELDDTWSWVALGQERQLDATVGAPEAVEDAPIADKGALAVLAPIQAPQLPPPIAGPARTMA